MTLDIQKYVKQIVQPKPNSRKGENGRVLVIGGSELFHAASFWSAASTAKIVDMVHFTSPAMENNELMRVRAKAKFWEGIVVPWDEVEHYIEEDDAILIGPGMTRGEETKKIVNQLLTKFPDKRWVVDGGALQEISPQFINSNMVITPNQRELDILAGKLLISNSQFLINDLILAITNKLGCTVLAKGVKDLVSDGVELVEIPGGNAGMTKGGTGDVLAGIVTGLYAKSQAIPSAVVASYVNKKAGEELSKKVEFFFSAGDLISEIVQTLGGLVKSV